MDGLVHLESYINSSEEKRKKAMGDQNKSWSSGGSGSTSPLPNRLSLFDKSYSGGSTNSLGTVFENYLKKVSLYLQNIFSMIWILALKIREFLSEINFEFWRENSTWNNLRIMFF